MARKSVASQVALLDQLKQDKKTLDSQIKEVEGWIIDHLDELGQKKISVDVSDRQITATKVQGTRTTIDENSLKRSLGEKLWLKVSTRILDKKKLEAYIASGEVDPLLVADCSTDSESAAYIKITA